MGQGFTTPVTNKETKIWENSNYIVAASTMQGWRLHMEDAHTCLLELPGDSKAAYFSVFDGHGGARVAKYASMHLHERVISQTGYESGNITEALRKAFLALDAEMQAEMTSHPVDYVLEQATKDSENTRSSHLGYSQSSQVRSRCTVPSMQFSSMLAGSRNSNPTDELAGSTGIVILLRDKMLYCGNAGDSRAVSCRCGIAEPLSADHKPTLKGEKERIIAAGGWVDANRVNGNLALSRALGDFIFKRNPHQTAENQIVSANPDVCVSRLVEDEDEFIILCCDGIWDVMTNQEVVSFVRLRLSFGMSPDRICEELMMRCLAPDCQTNGLGCDNMTVVLVCFLFGKPKSELQRRCCRPCPMGPAIDILGG